MMDMPVCPFVVDMLFRPEGKPMGQSDANADNQVGLQVTAAVRCRELRCGTPMWCRQAVQSSPAQLECRLSRSSPIQCNAMRCNAIRPNPGRSSSMTWMWMDVEGSRSTS